MDNRSSKNNKVRHAKATGAKQDTNQKKETIKNLESRPISIDTKTATQTKANTETKTQTKQFEPSKYIKQSPSEASATSKPKEQKTLSRTMTKKQKAITALIIIGGTLLVGILSSVLGGRMREGYEKPPAYPPDWLFPIVWGTLYILIGVAAYLAYLSSRDKKKRMSDMICYGVNLFFNLLWPLFFFRLDLLIVSSIWLVLYVISSIIVTYKFYKARMCSGVIFTIYTLWLLFALYLNLGITMLNINFM